MVAESIEVRLAVVEHEARATADRIERELATKADVESSKNSMIRWMFALMLAQPIVWLGAIAAARRLGLLG